MRIAVGLLACAGLMIVFLFQEFNASFWFYSGDSKITQFIINRIVRFLLNDLLALALIYALFPRRNYLIFAIYVQLAGIVLFLIPYLVLKIYYPTYNGPLINYLHRLILNPTLMILLIPAFLYQQRRKENPPV